MRDNGRMLRGRDSVGGARILAAELTESEASLRVYLAAGGLVTLGLVLLLLTIWWWRSTRPESAVLGPLEVMSERRFARAHDSDRRRMIDGHRPQGALALEGAVAAPVLVDLGALVRNHPIDFGDLRDPALADQAELQLPSRSAHVAAVELPASLSDAAPSLQADGGAADDETMIDPLLQRVTSSD